MRATADVVAFSMQWRLRRRQASPLTQSPAPFPPLWNEGTDLPSPSGSGDSSRRAAIPQQRFGQRRRGEQLSSRHRFCLVHSGSVARRQALLVPPPPPPPLNKDVYFLHFAFAADASVHSLRTFLFSSLKHSRVSRHSQPPLRLLPHVIPQVCVVSSQLSIPRSLAAGCSL
jgi:hypothetical protein